jgi:hypothetical protein
MVETVDVEDWFESMEVALSCCPMSAVTLEEK